MKERIASVNEAAATAGRAVEALDGPPGEGKVLPEVWRPEFVTPAQAERDLSDRDPRIQRYAQTVLGLSAETDRRGRMEERTGYRGHVL